VVDFKKLLKPRVINKLNNTTGSYVYIGRGSLWGNPFVVGKDGSRDEVIFKFINFYKKSRTIRAKNMRKNIKDLKGKNLGCFCAPAKCHGDFLLKKAN